IRPSRMASPPVQPISSSNSGAGSVSTTYEPKFVTRRATGRQPVAAALIATTIARPRELERPFRPEERNDTRERGPVAVQEASIPPTRPSAACLGFDDDDTRGRLTLLGRERRPEPGESTPHDADVRGDITL